MSGIRALPPFQVLPGSFQQPTQACLSLPQQLHPPSVPTNAPPAGMRQQTRPHTRVPTLLPIPALSQGHRHGQGSVYSTNPPTGEPPRAPELLSTPLCSSTWELHKSSSWSVDLGSAQTAARARLGRHSSWPGAFLPPLVAHPAALGPSLLCPPRATSSCSHTSHSLLPATAPGGTRHGPARAPMAGWQSQG